MGRRQATQLSFTSANQILPKSRSMLQVFQEVLTGNVQKMGSDLFAFAKTELLRNTKAHKIKKLLKLKTAER